MLKLLMLMEKQYKQEQKLVQMDQKEIVISLDSIVNVLDARIFRPAGDHIAYRLTKSGLLTMTESLAQALAPRIRVNAVALGAILPPPGEDEAALDRIARARVPLRRSGSVDFVAANVLHLLTQPFLTGVTIRLDGGEFL